MEFDHKKAGQFLDLSRNELFFVSYSNNIIHCWTQQQNRIAENTIELSENMPEPNKYAPE